MSVTQDDGVSLFADKGGGNNPHLARVPVPDRGLSAGALSEQRLGFLGPGDLYELFYTAANGLPKIPLTNFAVAASEPTAPPPP